MKKHTSLFASPWFFRASMIVFVLQASWIALSGSYSMAYDESTHLGIIRLYAQKWLPFWSQQPAMSDSLGAVSRDPSYLYHYLISFPFRIFAHFVHSEMAQVIFLRSFSIGLFVCGLLVFRKVLSNVGISKALLNVIFALLILTPVAPFLAAQINYDNLLFLATGTVLLLAQAFTIELHKKKRFNLKTLIILLGVCGLSSIVKYAFLPILVGVVLYVGYCLYKFFKRTTWLKVRKDLFRQFKAFTKLQLLAMGFLILLAGVLFFESYGVNTIRYHSPTPECDQVLSVERCLSYGPWRRNYLTYLDKQSGVLPRLSENPVNYAVTMWGKRITNELFFAVDGTSSNFMTRDPLKITRIASVGVIVFGLLFFLRWQRDIRKRYPLGLFITVSLVYVGLLWTQNYMDFLHLGFPFAIQGRYLIPVLPLLYLFMALGFSRMLKSQPALKPILAWVAIAFLITQGGGAGIYILKSQESWNWPNDTIVAINNWARGFLHHFTVGT